jgi:hypothetical protein
MNNLKKRAASTSTATFALGAKSARTSSSVAEESSRGADRRKGASL